MTRPTTYTIDVAPPTFGEILAGRRTFLLLAIPYQVAEGDTLELHEVVTADRGARTGRELTLMASFVDAELSGLIAEPGCVAVGFQGCHLTDNGRTKWVGDVRGRKAGAEGARA